MTFPMGFNDQEFSASQFPGDRHGLTLFTNVTYSEGLFMGYRWYDHHGIEPAFPFGHGLSYTSFEYGQIQVVGIMTTRNTEISINVTNVGDF